MIPEEAKMEIDGFENSEGQWALNIVNFLEIRKAI